MKKKNNDRVTFIKKNIIYIILLIVFLFASFVVWKRNQVNVPLPQQTLEVKPSAPKPQEFQQDLEALSQRIITLEQRSGPPQYSSNKLISVELYRGVLEESISIDALKAFLSRTPEPWAQAQLVSLAPIQHCLTYTKLDQLLGAPQQPSIPAEELTLWERVKRKVKSLISVRKIDSSGGYKYGQLEDVHKELLNHDIVKAIAAYEKLPDLEKQKLAVWLQAAGDRRMLENILSQILNDLAQGGTP